MIDRTNVCLALYFDPDQDPGVRDQVLAAFANALSRFPLWAILLAFDAWERRMKHRPSPGNIAILAEHEIDIYTREIRRRKAIAEAQQEDKNRRVVTPEEASEIMAAAGFTAKRMQTLERAPLATSMAEAERIAEPTRRPHWSETASPDSLEWATLRAAREANPIMRESMLAAQRRAQQSPSTDDPEQPGAPT